MKTKLLVILLGIGMIVCAATQAQTIRYVKEGGAGSKDGSSWTNASDDLQAMINASASGDQVWVAAGTYKRDNGDGNSFIMKDGVHVYGGFPAAGTPMMNDRTLPTSQTPTNQTILHGESARRVLGQLTDFTTSTVWDGFVIQHGMIHGNHSGIGAYLRGNGELRNCIIERNSVTINN